MRHPGSRVFYRPPFNPTRTGPAPWLPTVVLEARRVGGRLACYILHFDGDPVNAVFPTPAERCRKA